MTIAHTFKGVAKANVHTFKGIVIISVYIWKGVTIFDAHTFKGVDTGDGRDTGDRRALVALDRGARGGIEQAAPKAGRPGS